jgi:hypothetical protein
MPQKHLLAAEKEGRNTFLYGKWRQMHHTQGRRQRFRAAVRKFKETKKRAPFARWPLAASASTRQITTKIIFDTTEKDNPTQSAPGTPSGLPGPGKLYRLPPSSNPPSALLLRARLNVLIIQFAALTSPHGQLQLLVAAAHIHRDKSWSKKDSKVSEIQTSHCFSSLSSAVLPK